MSEKLKYNCEFNVEGMHCAACELVIEKKLSKFEGVTKVDAKLSENKVYLNIDSKNIDKQKLSEDLSKLIAEDGYKLEVNALKQKHNLKDYLISIIIALIIVAIFIALQMLGIVNLVSTDKITYPFVFFIGVVASLSSCMAVVGGLVLSMSSNYAKEKQVKPLILFHAARVIGFFLLGGLIGIIGSAFILTAAMSFILNLILFFVMIVLAINILDIFPFAKKLQLSMPKFIGKTVLNTNTENKFAPIVLGVITFFLPCGFTQSMQVYSLTTGSFIEGALTMLVFALGTLPVLALISFASVKLAKGFQSSIFYKTSGILIIFFAVFNLLSALVAVGIIPPFFNI